MAEETKKHDSKMETKHEEAKVETKHEHKEAKAETKTESKKETKVQKIKKDYAAASALNLSISPKEATDVFSMIRNKTVDTAIKMIEEVLLFKRVVRMNTREVPHQHGKGVMAGRFPMNTCKEFLRLLKQLRSTALYNELELEKVVVVGKADRASQPFRKGGSRFKRTHIFLRLEKRKENKIKTENKPKEKKK
jgi:ribosomal protein L22